MWGPARAEHIATGTLSAHSRSNCWPAQTKTYYMADDDAPVLKKAVGTPISWAPGKDPTKKVRLAFGTASQAASCCALGEQGSSRYKLR